MSKFLYKVFFTFTSTMWIIIIYGIDQKWSFINQSRFLTAIFLMSIPFLLSLILLLCIYLSKSADNISECQYINEANNDFIANYLGFFFIGIGLNNSYTLIFVYIIVFVLTFASQTQFFNPMFLVLRYKYYYVATSDGVNTMIISRKCYTKANELSTESLKRLSDTAFIEFGGKRNKK